MQHFQLCISLLLLSVLFFSVLSHELEQRLSLQERKELDEMLLTCLQLFTALVENHVAPINRNLQQTNPKKFQKFVIVYKICIHFYFFPYCAIYNMLSMLHRDIDTEVKLVQNQLLDMKVHEKVDSLCSSTNLICLIFT